VVDVVNVCPKHVELILKINKYCYLLHLVGLDFITCDTIFHNVGIYLFGDKASNPRRSDPFCVQFALWLEHRPVLKLPCLKSDLFQFFKKKLNKNTIGPDLALSVNLSTLSCIVCALPLVNITLCHM
jgi:hypothetical protein